MSIPEEAPRQLRSDGRGGCALDDMRSERRGGAARSAGDELQEFGELDGYFGTRG